MCYLQRFFEALLRWLSEKANSRLHVACLEAIRIVSREKSGLEIVSSERALKLLTGHAGLDMSCAALDEPVTIQDVAGNFCLISVRTFET